MKSALRHEGGVLLTILLLSLPALAQGVYSGSAQYSGAVFGAANSAGSFLGYTGQDIVPWPVTIPNAGGATRPGTILYEVSGLSEDVVVAPYATALGAMVQDLSRLSISSFSSTASFVANPVPLTNTSENGG